MKPICFGLLNRVLTFVFEKWFWLHPESEFGPLFLEMPKSYAFVFLLASISDQKPLISTESDDFYLSVAWSNYILPLQLFSSWKMLHNLPIEMR